MTDIPAGEVDEIVDICGTIFSNTRESVRRRTMRSQLTPTRHLTVYSGICIPEVFEHQSATAKTYAEVKVMASQGWMAISPMIKQVYSTVLVLSEHIADESFASGY